MDLDRFQQPIAARLAQIAERIEISEAKPAWRRRLGNLGSSRYHKRVNGLYIWGGVGRGKTMLMDQFFTNVELPRKQRLHFHQFMQQVHQRLRTHSHIANPLEVITTELARSTRLLCFDEFVVSDIGDAMILSELLRHMFHRGMVLVVTSNIEPRHLYADGLQRRRFLPAIDLLQKYCEVMHLDGPVDYRLSALRRKELYRVGTSLTSELSASDRQLFDGVSFEFSTTLNINDRKFQTVFCAQGVVGFTFEDLCIAPRSAADYLEIARLFHTLFIYEIPCLTSMLEAATTRFIALVDVLYDRKVNFVVHAAASITRLYTGTQSKTEFERTRSRIIEMASEDFLSSPHRA